MCRWVAYRGARCFLEDLVTSPAHSLIDQSQCATEAKTATNGDGFGIAWYGERDEPGHYRDILPAWSDDNLRSLSRQIASPLFLAHVRASTAGRTTRDNCHPFVHGRWSFMHNGQLGDFDRLERGLEARLDDRLYAARRGSTDSELLFLLALEFGLEEEPKRALEAAIGFVIAQAHALGLRPLVRFTAALSDGASLYCVRFATDRHAPTLYCGRMAGQEHDSYCMVSEPFDEEAGRWSQIPGSSFVSLDDTGVNVEPFRPAAPPRAVAI